MPERSTIPPDLGGLAQLLLDEWTQRLTGQLGELAAMLAEPKVTRDAPSDRVRFATLMVPSDRAIELVGAQLDRARITVRNTGTVVVALGEHQGIASDKSDRFDLQLSDVFTIDTRARLFVRAASAQGELAIVVEEWDQ